MLSMERVIQSLIWACCIAYWRNLSSVGRLTPSLVLKSLKLDGVSTSKLTDSIAKGKHTTNIHQPFVPEKGHRKASIFNAVLFQRARFSSISFCTSLPASQLQPPTGQVVPQQWELVGNRLHRLGLGFFSGNPYNLLMGEVMLGGATREHTFVGYF